MHDAWLQPQWPAPPWVQAICTTRQGGVSKSPFDSFNLGDHVGDDPKAVQRNRQALRDSLVARPVFLSQLHGVEVQPLALEQADGLPADASLTRAAGLACTILVADCLPILFTDRSGSFVAAAHAGWRGLAGLQGRGVLESLVDQVLATGNTSTEALLAWIGPGIGPQAFEVGSEVRDIFVDSDPNAAICFQPTDRDGKWLADLAQLARLRLGKLGMRNIFGNDGSKDWCTVHNPSRFFSHRRDRISGRMAACIWLAR